MLESPPAGCPCYGPFPDVIKLPSMLTPKRAGNAKERGSKKGDDKDEPVARKGKKDCEKWTVSPGLRVVRVF